MNDLANELKQELDQLFATATEESERRACPPGGDAPMDDETRQAFASVQEAIQGMIEGSLDPEALHSLPEKGSMDDLRMALAFHPYYTFESWHVREDVSEKALLAAEKDIRAGRIRKLEHLRDQKRNMDYAMPIFESYGSYMQLLNNLSYLFWVWAHLAKRYNSFDAAKHFLQAISLINVRKTRTVPNFKEEDIDALIEYMLDGADELKIAADYHLLENWSTFQKKESQKLAAAKKKLADIRKKGGK